MQDVSEVIDEFELYDVCEADEIYLTAGEKGIEKEDEDESPRSYGLKKGAGTIRIRQTASIDTCPSERRTPWFLVCKNLEDADEDIAEYGDGSIPLY